MLSLKRFLFAALKRLIPFVCLEVLIVALFAAQIAGESLFAVVSLVNAVFLLFPGVTYLAQYVYYGKRCLGLTPTEGVVKTWQTGFFRYTGGLTVQVGGRDYETAACFGYDECRELIGKTVRCAVVGETVILYEVLG